MAIVIPHKRGDTFQLRATAAQAGVDFTGWTVRCQVRVPGARGAPLSEAVVTHVSRVLGSWVFDLKVADTTEWPIATLKSDIEYMTPGGQVVSTETFDIQCVEDITRS